jgi:rhomboid protease GluP
VPAVDNFSADNTGTPTIAFGDDVIVRQTTNRDRADEWTLVLTAVGVSHRLLQDGGGTIAVSVPRGELPAAQRALDADDRERIAGAPTAPAAPDRGTGALGIVLGMLLIGFQYLTGLWETQATSRWFTTGVASAELIRAGEWWRAVTAMTLHADLMHLLGNVAASVIFVSAAARWLGSGMAAVLILLAGTGANLLTAVVEKKDHLSVGASTATFAALGIVAGLQCVRRWRGGGSVRRRAWIAAGAGVALLAMLGFGARADVFAHVFGLGLGIVLGVIAGVLDRNSRPARPGVNVRAWLMQGGLAALALGAVVAAWARALGRI